MSSATPVMMTVRTTAIDAANPTRLYENAFWNISHDGTAVSPPGPPAVVF
jgi:hypothetical protein